ncbi:MAG: MATE family efflux transporter [Lachnospiraceae bacterium]|nr:MATE family efflux transporter [Lachnospiraceae bacterium]
MNTNKTLKQLFIPIFIETLFYMLAGFVDTLMMSSLGDKAVGAVGTSNTYISIFLIAFSIISSGTMAVMTRYIGANRSGIAYQAKNISLLFNGTIGVVLSLVLFKFSGSILTVLKMAPSLMPAGSSYLKIVGGFCFLNAVIPVYSGYLRAFGYTKEPLYISLIANIINIFLNALFLFVLGFGVEGVAFATVISKIFNLLAVYVLTKKLIKAHLSKERIKNKALLGQIIGIGLPSALESALYNVAMTLIIMMLNSMDSEGINATARTYATQITTFSYCTAAALASANAILTGWRIGAKKYEECEKGTLYAVKISVLVAVSVEIIITVFSGYIMRIFTHDPVMIKIVSRLLAIDIILEFGRASNLVFGNALKTCQDAVYIMVIAIIFMYVLAVGCTYILGIHFKWYVYGAYVGLAADECVRAVCMYLRFKKGKWKDKVLVIE